MSPTSCHCSTPRCWERSGIGWWWGSLTCARDGLASHAVARAVLSGAGAGHDPVRDGTGWFDAALGHAHRSRTHRTGSPDLWEHHEESKNHTDFVHVLRCADGSIPRTVACACRSRHPSGVRSGCGGAEEYTPLDHEHGFAPVGCPPSTCRLATGSSSRGLTSLE